MAIFTNDDNGGFRGAGPILGDAAQSAWGGAKKFGQGTANLAGWLWNGDPTGQASGPITRSQLPQHRQMTPWDNDYAQSSYPSPQSQTMNLTTQAPQINSNPSPASAQSFMPTSDTQSAGADMYSRIGGQMGPGSYHMPQMPKANFPTVAGVNVNPWVDAINQYNAAGPQAHQARMAGYDEGDRAIQQIMNQQMAKYLPMREQMGLMQGMSGLQSGDLARQVQQMQLMGYPAEHITQMIERLGQVFPRTPEINALLQMYGQNLYGGPVPNGGGAYGGSAQPGAYGQQGQMPGQQGQPGQDAGAGRAFMHALIPGLAGAAGWSGASALLGKLGGFGGPWGTAAGMLLPLGASMLTGYGANQAMNAVDPTGGAAMAQHPFAAGFGGLAGTVGGYKGMQRLGMGGVGAASPGAAVGMNPEQAALGSEYENPTGVNSGYLPPQASPGIIPPQRQLPAPSGPTPGRVFQMPNAPMPSAPLSSTSGAATTPGGPSAANVQQQATAAAMPANVKPGAASSQPYQAEQFQLPGMQASGNFRSTALPSAGAKKVAVGSQGVAMTQRANATEQQYNDYIMGLIAERGSPQSMSQLQALGFTPEMAEAIAMKYAPQGPAVTGPKFPAKFTGAGAAIPQQHNNIPGGGKAF